MDELDVEKQPYATDKEINYLDEIEKEREKVLAEREALLQESDELKEWLRNGKSQPKTLYILKKNRSRLLGRETQKNAASLSKLRLQKTKINKILSNRKNQENVKIRNLLKRAEIKWEAFFVEAARSYLSGQEFEIISRNATSMVNIRKSD